MTSCMSLEMSLLHKSMIMPLMFTNRLLTREKKVYSSQFKSSIVGHILFKLIKLLKEVSQVKCSKDINILKPGYS